MDVQVSVSIPILTRKSIHDCHTADNFRGMLGTLRKRPLYAASSAQCEFESSSKLIEAQQSSDKAPAFRGYQRYQNHGTHRFMLNCRDVNITGMITYAQVQPELGSKITWHHTGCGWVISKNVVRNEPKSCSSPTHL